MVDAGEEAVLDHLRVVEQLLRVAQGSGWHAGAVEDREPLVRALTAEQRLRLSDELLRARLGLGVRDVDLVGSLTDAPVLHAERAEQLATERRAQTAYGDEAVGGLVAAVVEIADD